MKSLYLSLLLLITKAALCCSCAPKFDFKVKEDLKEYDYIALVTIKEVAPYDSINRFMHLRTSGKIQADIIECFRGEPLTNFNDPSYKSDCAFVLKKGERWLFFGNKVDGVIDISVCGYSVKYSSDNGLREWNYFTGLRQLDVLRNIYEHPILSNIINRQLYPNGNIEVEQTFKNGKLDGIRKIYYPDGKLYLTEEFQDGNRVGYRNYYGLSGQLRISKQYKNGLIRRSITYQDTTEDAWYMNYQINNHTDMLFGDKEHDIAFFLRKLDSLRQLKNWDKQIASITKFSKNGLSYTTKSFDYKGDIKTTVLQDWRDNQINETYHYREDGKIQYYTLYDNKNNRQIEHDYDKNGSRRDFLSKCEYCKFYFDKNLLPSTPEKIYIQ